MIELAEFDQGCYEKLISWVDSEETLMQFAGPGFTFPLTKEQLDQSRTDLNRFSFQVVDANLKEMIGYAEIYLRNETTYLARILIGNKDLRGNGIGQQIVRQLLDIAFINLERDKVELNVFDWNRSAIKCYENSGFTINHDKKTERTVGGQTWIALNMVIDKTKWEQRIKNEILK